MNARTQLPEPPAAIVLPDRRGKARLSDRRYLQLLVDLGELDLPLTPDAPVPEHSVRAILFAHRAAGTSTLTAWEQDYVAQHVQHLAA